MFIKISKDHRTAWESACAILNLTPTFFTVDKTPDVMQCMVVDGEGLSPTLTEAVRLGMYVQGFIDEVVVKKYETLYDVKIKTVLP